MTITETEDSILITNANMPEDYPNKQKLFREPWPARMNFLACRRWGHLQVNGDTCHIMSTFMTTPDSPINRTAITAFFTSCDPVRFEQWLVQACEKLLLDTLTNDWFSDLEFSKQMKTRANVQVRAMLTFPPDGLGFIHTGPPTVGRNLHVVFVLGQA